MIVQMSKAYVVVRKKDRDELLDRLGKMKLLHFQPVRPNEVVPDEETLQKIADIDRALEILLPLEGAKGSIENPVESAREAIEIHASIIENQKRLNELHQEMEKLKIWGNVRLSQFESLRENGIEVRFYRVPQAKVHEIRAECSEVITPLPGKRELVAVVDRGGQFRMPEGSDPVPIPIQDRAAIVAEAKKITKDLQDCHERLSQLAAVRSVLQAERDRLLSENAYVKAKRSGLSLDELFAVQGWVPSEKAEGLRVRLSEDGFHAAVLLHAVTEEDAPPTLIRYPKWTRPIKGLFDILGTLPAYREMDLSPFFMVALPLFAGMLIGDAGYGLLISLFGILFHKRLVRVGGRPKAQIIIVFGLATLFWGILTANYFGITPTSMTKAGGFVKTAPGGGVVDDAALRAEDGFYGYAAKMMRRGGLLWKEDPKAARFLLIKVSLLIGCLHLILARIRKMVELIPDPRALAEAGWVLTLADMLALIWYLLFVGVERVPAFLWWILLATVLLSSWFALPRKGVLKRILLGLASSLLPLLNTFSDTMSYLRLFAVGLASYFIASAFNDLSVQVAQTATWFAAVPLLIFGHGLNIGLATIAIFAHGVRLNMLEFSNNVGVQWSGYAYRPFATKQGTIFGEERL